MVENFKNNVNSKLYQIDPSRKKFSIDIGMINNDTFVTSMLHMIRQGDGANAHVPIFHGAIKLSAGDY